MKKKINSATVIRILEFKKKLDDQLNSHNRLSWPELRELSGRCLHVNRDEARQFWKELSEYECLRLNKNGLRAPKEEAQE